jgi:hypothetical protein
MPRIIFTSRYLSAAPKAQIANLVDYMAKRDGVDKSLSEKSSRPATEKQRQFINRLLEIVPDTR